jgi:L-fucose isomerase-like protein
MDYQAIISKDVGIDNARGTVVGRLRASPITYCRVSTNDLDGRVMAYYGEGELTNDPVKTFGGYGVVKIANFQKLLAHICENGYEHHVAINPAHLAGVLDEALGKYMGWQVYHHGKGQS